MSLIFSIAYNGYDRVWDKCIDSHGVYAARHGYAQSVVGQGDLSDLSMEVAWLKIPLLIAALDAGNEWVMFIDSDAMFSDIAPPFESVEKKEKDVYLASGYSGRPNSGVIIVKNTSGARDFLSQVLAIAGKQLPKKHRVGWGENGEVIHITSQYVGYENISRKWNNNFNPDLDDYVRHYSAGPLRKLYERDKTSQRGLKKSLHYHPSSRPGSREFYAGLLSLLEELPETPIFDLFRVRSQLASLGN
ncbi:putative nucleotide-diphospho-sugar transferase [Celeribacter persicus]|uniref:Galactosyl transferase GMA12/MNN10 family protein n=1 Tax=Celeribacter persicus TaxID=1651082 RepID=A0A2T5GN18_9RHOB|nr:putative nucleotide-diphospho-sugar transferase [Celeribacter persicus]PTQ60739.1 galactosyl transferase GMA12/MNN10 family protein [Celeribacter persicus]